MSTAQQASGVRASQPVQEEIKIKKQQLAELMAKHKLAGVLLSLHENVAWATAGQVDMRVAIPSATGAAAVFVRKDGSGFYITTKNEAPRMHDEEFGGLPFEPVVLPWQEGDFVKAARGLAAAGALGADTQEANCDIHQPCRTAQPVAAHRDRAVSIAGRHDGARCRGGGSAS